MPERYTLTDHAPLAARAEWPELFRNIIWSGEAVFHGGGFVNRHNCHYTYWAGEGEAADTGTAKCDGVVWYDCGSDCESQ